MLGLSPLERVVNEEPYHSATYENQSQEESQKGQQETNGQLASVQAGHIKMVGWPLESIAGQPPMRAPWHMIPIGPELPTQHTSLEDQAELGIAQTRQWPAADHGTARAADPRTTP